jgi:DNA-binding NtrC family response regulator
MSQIMVVDDEVGIRELLSEILADEGHQVRLAQNASEARQLRARARPDLVLLDIWMPDTDGITLLKEWAERGQLTMPVVMMSGHGTIDTAVEATRIGAYAFLEKPIALQKLLSTVGSALTHAVQSHAAAPGMSLAILGGTPGIADLKGRLERARELRSPVLLLAEPGSGEELCARYLHRMNTPWMVFGEEEDVGVAGEGTLFVPDVDTLGREGQRVLLARLATLVNSGTRVVATARPAISRQVAEGGVDARLYSALSGMTVRVPPLREHADDVPAIATQLLNRMIEAREIPMRSFSTAALNALRLHPWPGNLAQLESVVRALALGTTGQEIRLQDTMAVLGPLDGPPVPAVEGVSLDAELRDARDAFERSYFEYHIAREGGNMSRIAAKSGLERTHLYRKLKQLGIALPRRAD